MASAAGAGAVAAGSGASAARPPQAVSPTPAKPTLGELTGPTADRPAVISYLGELISWYRHLEVEERLAAEPAETLYVADDRQNANRVLDLGFEYADTAAKFLNQKTAAPVTSIPLESAGAASNTPAATPAARTGANQLNNLLARRAEAQATAAAANSNVQQLKQALTHARRKQRDIIAHQLATAEAELALAQSQVDALGAMIDFENGSGGAGSDLQTQIDQLKAAVRPGGGEQKAPQLSMPEVAEAATGAVRRSGPTASGMVGQAESLIAMTQKSQSLDDTIDLTNHLLAATEQLRKPLRDEIRQINQQVLELAANSASNNLAIVKDTQSRVEKLTARHKLVLAALLPLSMQTMILKQYVANLGRWRSMLAQRWRAELQNLLLRVGGLVMLMLGIVGGAALWRRLTFRYVHDTQRRHQVLQLSRIIVVVIIGLVLLFDFANELGTLATVMGFAAAGIALTLQNVILSLAGYFYVSGRYGIRVGDRVQISGISGDVLEIGLFKMTLMELGNEESGHQLTGRVVVFPNSVVFQPNGNFSKQLPGSNFAWNELRLTLAPDCDYRLAERRLVEVVSDVFTRYRDTIQREYRGLERDLNLRIETPRPQSRLRLSDAGIELVIRYPVQFKSATQTSDEIARHLVDAIKREPALRLVTPGTPMIQPVDGTEAADRPHEGFSNGGAQLPDSGPAAIDHRAAAVVAAAAAGATVANAFVETSAAAQKREGVTAAAPPFAKS